jgi:hypothetical protein
VIYIVTGDGPRCGSSMLMAALQAGGMHLAFDMRCDYLEMDVKKRKLVEDGASLYELPLGATLQPGFPNPDEYEGKAFKLWAPPWGNLTHLRPGEYTVFWLHRSREHRWASFDKQHEGTNVHLGEAEKLLRDLAVEDAFKICVWRQDMKVIELDYEAVVARPVETFRRLQHLGVPLNAERAGAIPDKSKREFGV